MSRIYTPSNAPIYTRPSRFNFRSASYRNTFGCAFDHYIAVNYQDHERVSLMIDGDTTDFETMRDLVRPTGEYTSHVHKACRGMEVHEWTSVVQS